MHRIPRRLRKYLRTRSGFIRIGTATFGGAMAIFMLWYVGAVGGIGWWLFLIALATGSGWLWSYFMWEALKTDIGPPPRS